MDMYILLYYTCNVLYMYMYMYTYSFYTYTYSFYTVQLYLIDKTDVSWWSMQSQSGAQGLVPVNYIDKLDVSQEQQAANKVDDHTHSSTATTTNGEMDNGVNVFHR